MIVDLVIIVVLAAAAFVSARRGAVSAGLGLVATSIAACVALVFYRPLAAVVAPGTREIVSVANLMAFAVIWIVVRVGLDLIIQPLIPLPLRKNALTPRSKWLGAGLGLLSACVIVTIILTLYAGLPISSSSISAVSDTSLASLALDTSMNIQMHLGTQPGATLDAVTVPSSRDSEPLGFDDAGPTTDSTAARQIFAALNVERAAHGLKPLLLALSAQSATRAHSLDMLKSGYLSAVSLGGTTPAQRLHAAGLVAENVAIGSTTRLITSCLWASAPQRAVILSPEYRYLSVGVADAPDHELVATEDFLP